jgi:hypothetical protein
VFDLQDQVTATVVAAVAPRLSGDATRYGSSSVSQYK